MQELVSFSMVDSAGAPYPGANPVFIAYKTPGGSTPTPPTIGDLGNGTYVFLADPLAAGGQLAFLISGVIGSFPKYVAGSIFEDSSPFAAMLMLDGTGDLYEGPLDLSVAFFKDATGADRVPPPLIAVDGRHLWAIRPTADDALTGVVFGVDAPNGVFPRRVTGSFSIPSGGALTSPDADIANLLAAVSPGPSLGTVAVDIFRGPVRPAKPPTVPHASIFVLASGIPQPVAFIAGTSKKSFYRVSVVIRVRSEADQFGPGQEKAKAVFAKVNLANLAGYTWCRATNSHPVYIGQDDTEHHEWNIGVTVAFKQ